jgi:uncharacterized membrane protein YkoI
MFGMLMLLSAFALSGSPALAASNTNSTNSTEDVCAEVEDMDNEQDENDNESDDAEENDAEDLCEKVESAKLASQVDISEGKARQIAEDNYTGNGKITEVQLGNEEDDNGVSTIIYEIEFTESDGKQVDVKVDAMSGKYLGEDMEDGEDGGNKSDDTEKVKGANGNANIQALQMQLMSLLQQLIALLKAQ